MGKYKLSTFYLYKHTTYHSDNLKFASNNKKSPKYMCDFK